MRKYHEIALEKAYAAALEHAGKYGESWPCGFAWVQVKADGRSKVAKELKALGFRKSWLNGYLYLWNPSGYASQSMDILESGAMAYAELMREKTGLDFSAGSRLD
jgi:hypothetical protein